MQIVTRPPAGPPARRRGLAAAQALAVTAALLLAVPAAAGAEEGADEWAGSAACQWVNAQPTASGTTTPFQGLAASDSTNPGPDTLSIRVPDELVPTMLPGETYTARGDAHTYAVSFVWDDGGGAFPVGFSSTAFGLTDPPRSAASNALFETTVRTLVATHLSAYVASGSYRVVGTEIVYVPPTFLGPVTLDVSCAPGASPVAGLELSAYGPPVDAGVLNVAQPGRTIPFKFSVSRSGRPVLGLTAADVSGLAQPYDCAGGEDTGGPVEAHATGGSGLRDLGGGRYQLNLTTSKSWKGCYRVGLTVDGVTRTEDFRF